MTKTMYLVSIKVNVDNSLPARLFKTRESAQQWMNEQKKQTGYVYLIQEIAVED